MCNHGWYVNNNGKYAPTLTEDPVASPELLKLTICNCKKSCNTSKCSCKATGLNVSPHVGVAMDKNAATAKISAMRRKLMRTISL